MDGQQANNVAFKIYDNEDYFKKGTDDPNILEHEVTDVIMETLNTLLTSTTKQIICLKQQRK